MVYSYLRYSTSSQEDVQQRQAIKEWTEPRGITIDEFVSDEGISGGVSYRNRKLYGLVKKLSPGDVLVVSEISRLGRSMHDISDLLSQELKPRKVRLVVIKMGIDVDCSNLRAADEFLFSALAFAAQIEKELIQSRTQSALDARKEYLREDGGFFSKSGRWCTHLGRAKGCDPKEGYTAAGMASANKAAAWRKDSPLFLWVRRQVQKGRPRREIVEEAQEMYKDNPKAYCTPGGTPLSLPILCKWVQIIQKSM